MLVSKETGHFSSRKFQYASLPLGCAIRETEWLNAQGRFSKLLGNKVLSCEIGFILHSYLKQTMYHATTWKFFSWLPVVTCIPFIPSPSALWYTRQAASPQSQLPLMTSRQEVEDKTEDLQISTAILELVIMGSGQQTCMYLNTSF